MTVKKGEAGRRVGATDHWANQLHCWPVTLFSTIQPGERPNDRSTALEGKRLPKRSAFSDSFPEKANLGSLLFAQNADAPIYFPVAKTRIPAAPVTCERICGST